MEIDQSTLMTILKDMVEQDIKTQQFMEAEKEARQKRDQVIDGLIDQIRNFKVEAPKPDLSLVVAAIDQGYQLITSAIEKKPMSIERKLKINLFPETNVREYYRMVFGRLFFWGLMFLIVIYLGSFINQSIDAYQARQYNKEGNSCISAWNEIYAQSGKLQRERMSKALAKAKEEQQ